MRTLIYKRTHSGDPDPTSGLFGVHDCMGRDRDRMFEAVIGVGGIGEEPQRWNIAGKLTWVGIGPHRVALPGGRGPLVSFEHFRYYGEDGQLLIELAPRLAARLYGCNVRVLIDDLSSVERREVGRILELAKNAPASSSLRLRENRTRTRDTECSTGRSMKRGRRKRCWCPNRG